MLALMPQPVPSPDMSSLSPLTPRPTNTAFPTPPQPEQFLCSQQKQQQIRRPKLSLDTTAPPAIGNRKTSLRLDTLSATASPTSRNTLTNAWRSQDKISTPQTSKYNSPCGRPRLTIDLTRSTKRVSLVYANTLSPASTPQTAISTSTISTPSTIPTIITSDADSSDSESDSVSSLSSSGASASPPYRVPYNVNSILTNGPIPRRRRINTPRRALFPAAKKVNFRANLTEEVQNRVYVMANSDIDSPIPTASSFSTFCARTPVTARRVGGFEAAPLSAITEVQSQMELEKCPTTPVAGRSKRTRDWVWTLGPVGNGDVGAWEGNEEE